jgi:hypothetical protein
MGKLHIEPNDSFNAPEGLKTYLNDSIGKTNVDSLKLRIPFSKITILNSEIVDKIGVYNCATGEELEEPKARNWYRVPKLNDKKEILYSYKYEILNITLDKGITDKYLCIQLNAKMLHIDYFEGITESNLKLVYDRLMSDKVVSFSYEALKLSEVTDVDFKKDIISKDFKKATEVLYEMSKSYKQAKKGANIFGKPKVKGIGIEWSNRQTATPSNPFFKLYSKAVQCTFHNKMIPFYREYLKDGTEQVEDRIRIEYTIKNKKHFRKYGIESCRLIDVLRLTEAKKEFIRKDMISIHLHSRIAQSIKPKEGLNPTEAIHYSTMSYMVENTMLSKEDIVKQHIEFVVEKVARYRAKKKLNDIYDTYISARKKAKENESLSNLFDALNW